MTCYRFHEHGVIVFSEIVLFLNEMTLFTHEITFQQVLVLSVMALVMSHLVEGLTARSTFEVISICPFSSGLCACLARGCPLVRPFVGAGNGRSLHRSLLLASYSDLGFEELFINLCDIPDVF